MRWYTILLFVLFFVPSVYYGGIYGFTIYVVLASWARNVWCQSFQRAGPRTSRQIPPTPIHKCMQLSAQELSAAYEAGTYTVVEVVRAYIEHIKVVNPYLNVMVFDTFEEAMQTAVKADKTWAKWRQTRDPRTKPSWLLGVPCTIKECMQCRGCPNSSGHPNRENIISEVDSPVVHNFREAGAIILGVTNTSELCMWYESSNYVYGITCNPYDTRCLVGGSSGGEGAAAGAVFSCFSLGSDIGGSIRMPAFFNGVYGHKASPHYISNNGQYPGAKSSANHYMATGPITRFAEDLLPLCEVAARGGFRLDSKEFPPCKPLEKLIDLDHMKGKKVLKVYALEDYGIPCIPVSDSEVEAVHTAAEVLRDRYGAEVQYINVRNASRCTGGVIPEEFKPFSRILSMWADVLTKDPTETKFNELMATGHEGISWFAEVGRWLRGKSRHTIPAIALCLLELGETYLPSFLTVSQSGAIGPFRAGLIKLLEDNQAVIICPSFPSPAPRHHYVLWNPFQFQYCAAFNVLQFPSTACPMWPTRQELAEETRRGRKSILRKALSMFEVRRRGLPDDYHLPKGVQVVSAPNQDELCLSTTLALQDAAGYRYPSWAELEGQVF
ncbi:fatty acid amide hydrolase 2 [Angomonas deanei]|nr:fatty acid amide hydrolase 2 [Angomonas deanei]|eukprot:EPY39542.1 fatty acid amide hydrolase 2 [Angomonas deanei]